MKNKVISLLLVEDDKVDQMAFERFVKRENLLYDYVIAGSVAEASEILKSSSFDVIISDYVLGDGTSFELFDSYKGTPVIITTGSGDEEVAVAAMKLGACDYLIKDPEGNYLKTLPITVELALKRKQNEEELQNYHERLESMVKERTAELQAEIVERKKVEQQRHEFEAQLHQKHKMEALGVMAGGMAHNFNNNLAIILGNVELAQMKQPQHSEAIPLLKNAKIAVLRARDLIRNILIYSREGAHDKALIQLPTVVDETINLLRSTIPSTVNLQLTISPDSNDVTINADPSQIQEALFNLCNNAVHAMGEKGELKVVLDTVNLTRQDISVQYAQPPGRYAKLSIQDNGAGMTEETKGKVFDLFFTTKEINEGTGVGLSTVQGIVNQHNGLIKVKSTPGEGTTFDLYFPVIDPQQAVETTAKNVSLPRGTENILFVDDDEMLANLGGTLLSEMGYQVTTMTESTEALKMLTANADHFDLVITDQTMPELTGKELIQKILQIRPDLPNILCTGFSTKVDEKSAKQFGINAFLMKPLDLPELLQTVRQVLDGGK